MHQIINAYAIPGIKDRTELPQSRTFKEERILFAVADYFGITIEMLQSVNRGREIVYPRHIAKHLLKKFTTLSLKQIGTNFKSQRRKFKKYQDHTTVLHSLKTVKNWYDTHDEWADHVNKIINKYL